VQLSGFDRDPLRDQSPTKIPNFKPITHVTCLRRVVDVVVVEAYKYFLGWDSNACHNKYSVLQIMLVVLECIRARKILSNLVKYIWMPNTKWADGRSTGWTRIRRVNKLSH